MASPGTSRAMPPTRGWFRRFAPETVADAGRAGGTPARVPADEADAASGRAEQDRGFMRGRSFGNLDGRIREIGRIGRTDTGATGAAA